nr:immunoglobulin heavy chain junction region [Homo sapiens]
DNRLRCTRERQIHHL